MLYLMRYGSQKGFKQQKMTFKVIAIRAIQLTTYDPISLPLQLHLYLVPFLKFFSYFSKIKVT